MEVEQMKPVVTIGLCFLLLLGMAGCAKPPPEYTLNIGVSGDGSVAPTSGTKFKSGTVVELIPTASSGSAFDKWSGPDATSVVTNVGKHTIIMDKSKSITAVFIKIEHEVTVNVTPPGSGSVEVSLADISASASYEHGQVISLLASPASGCSFDHWEGDLSGNANPATLTVDAPKNVTAVFTCTVTGKVIGGSSHTGIANLTINYSGANSGQVTTDSSGNYSITTNGNITLTPAALQDAIFFAADPPSIQTNGPSNNADFAVFAVMHETAWGSYGSENSQFMEMRQAIVNSVGNVLVADTYNHRIQTFDCNGGFISKWDSYGSSETFDRPIDIAIDSTGNMYIVELSDCVKKFNSAGEFISKWGATGSSNGLFDWPIAIAIDSLDNVYIADNDNNRIQKFASDGSYISQWGVSGNASGQFSSPYDIAIDSLDNVYVVDQGNSRIQKFTSDGTFITQWNIKHSSLNEFYLPYGIAIDSYNNVYVTNSISQIQKFTSDGVLLATWGQNGEEVGQFDYAHGMVVDNYNNLYVVDADNSRIQKLRLIQ